MGVQGRGGVGSRGAQSRTLRWEGTTRRGVTGGRVLETFEKGTFAAERSRDVIHPGSGVNRGFQGVFCGVEHGSRGGSQREVGLSQTSCFWLFGPPRQSTVGILAVSNGRHAFCGGHVSLILFSSSAFSLRKSSFRKTRLSSFCGCSGRLPLMRTIVSFFSSAE